MIIRKFRSLLRLLSTYLKRKRASVLSGKQLRSLASIVDNPFFVIIMPGSLQILKKFMQYIPDAVNIVFIFNGLDNWEKNWVQSKYADLHSIVLETTLKHDTVIDLLIDRFRKPFGIIDSDCFVFDSRLFEEMQTISNRTMVNALFLYNNAQLNLDVPQTYFLYINPKPIAEIKARYHINSKPYKYEKLSKKIRKQISKIGIDSTHNPESFKPLFDTLRLIICLGLSDGYQVNYPRKYQSSLLPNQEIYHVGAVYCNDNIKRLTLFRGSYFWRLCLDKSHDPDLIDRYHRKYGSLTSQELLKSNLEFAEYSSTKNFVEFVEKIIDGKV